MTSPATTTAALCVAFSLLSTAPSVAFSSTSRQSSSSSTGIKTPVVICPGFGNDLIDYIEPLKQPREVGFASTLERRGFESINIVPVKRSDWIKVAGGLLDINFYTNKALPTGGGYGWYIERLKECVDEAYEQSGGERVLLVGHSAGGWLARAAMGDGLWDSETGVRTSDRVRCLTTIGAIHRPPADVGTCVTRGALAYTDRAYPGAFLAAEGVGYVSVGGMAIEGNDAKHSMADVPTDADQIYATRGEGSQARVAYTSYEAVCGQGYVSGDGVVPFEWSQLEGAKQIPLDGVVHSINEAGTTLPTDRWYGSEGVVDRWLPAVLDEAGISNNNKSGGGLGLDGLQRWAMDAQKALFTQQ